MAQVYSQNAVGYVNVTVPGGKLQMIANQLTSANMTLGALIPSPPDGSTVYQFLPNGNYNISTYLGFLSAWDPDPNISLAPGAGVFFLNPDAAPYTITFVGEVPQGSLSTAIPAGLAIRASQVPQSGGITSVLGFPAQDGDTCYQYVPSSGAYIINTYLGFLNAWDPNEPTPQVGESFFIQSSAAKSWNRTFSVN
jgi:hypothetical protein